MAFCCWRFVMLHPPLYSRHLGLNHLGSTNSKFVGNQNVYGNQSADIVGQYVQHCETWTNRTWNNTCQSIGKGTIRYFTHCNWFRCLGTRKTEDLTAAGPPTRNRFCTTNLHVGKNSIKEPPGCSTVQAPPKHVVRRTNAHILRAKRTAGRLEVGHGGDGCKLLVMYPGIT